MTKQTKDKTMDFIRWILSNFGFFFGGVFLIYLYFIVRRLTIIYDVIRDVPAQQDSIPLPVGPVKVLGFLDRLFERLKSVAPSSSESIGPVIDAIWSEVECHVSVHFTAVNGYVNTLILVGFAGTIFGSIGAFNEMFQGLAKGETAAIVFVGSWNNGLATALYTSLGAAAIGGIMITIVCSRYLMTRAKRLETLVGLRIGEIIEEVQSCSAEDEKQESVLNEPRTRERISLPISSS